MHDGIVDRHDDFLFFFNYMAKRAKQVSGKKRIVVYICLFHFYLFMYRQFNIGKKKAFLCSSRLSFSIDKMQGKVISIHLKDIYSSTDPFTNAYNMFLIEHSYFLLLNNEFFLTKL